MNVYCLLHIPSGELVQVSYAKDRNKIYSFYFIPSVFPETKGRYTTYHILESDKKSFGDRVIFQICRQAVDYANVRLSGHEFEYQLCGELND